MILDASFNAATGKADFVKIGDGFDVRVLAQRTQHINIAGGLVVVRHQHGIQRFLVRQRHPAAVFVKFARQ